jgi:tRNA(Ile)-lysidine synthase
MNSATAVEVAIDAFAERGPKLPLAVAYSGGADSTALLVACAERWPEQVQAWHVHHGLQAAADAFANHCAARCRELGVPLTIERVDARSGRGESPEDAARTRRYQAFDRLAARLNVPAVALAQHADDQAETILLALSRGAGLPGLAAMAMHWSRAGTDYWRPLLHVPRSAIRAWLQARGIDWIEDPTNINLRYARNRVRAQLLPVLDRIFPAFRTTFARSADHAAQAQEILTDVAALDLAACGDPPRIAALRGLTPARRANALRHWLKTRGGRAPTRAQLDELQAQIEACMTRGHHIDLKVADGRVRRVGEALCWAAAVSQPAPSEPLK